jgi:hypothetical protein
MVDRPDPARAGVRAGRVVGLLTAGLVVVTVAFRQESLYAVASVWLDLFGVESGRLATVLLWGNALLAAASRFAISYTVGSLVGVVYDWLDRPPLPVLAVLVVLVGIVDGVLSGIDARSVAIGGAYVLAWCCYLPAFVWLHAGDDTPDGPRRLG